MRNVFFSSRKYMSLGLVVFATPIAFFIYSDYILSSADRFILVR